MKVLLITLEYHPCRGGVANYYGSLVKYWPEPNNIYVLDNHDDKLLSKKMPFLKWLPSLFCLWSKVKANQIDYILVGNVLPLGTVVYLMAKFLNIKYAVILHGMDFSYALKKKRKEFLAKKILLKAEKIICTNNYTADLVKKYLKNYAGSIKVVNPGIELEAGFNHELFIELKNRYALTDKIVLLSVGRLVKRKGFAKVIDALPAVLPNVPNLIYIILGNGQELSNLNSQIVKLNLENKVKIITNANDNERNAWFRLCDLFIMPSRNINGDFEGFGIVYLEANLAGKPVIAGKSGGVPDTVIDGLNGLMVNPENNYDISQAIIKLAQDEKLREKLGYQGQRRALAEFSWPKQIVKFYALIK